jgi:hypothetical protein
MMTALCKKDEFAVSSLLGSIDIMADIASPTLRDDVKVVPNALAVELGLLTLWRMSGRHISV